MNNKQPFDEFNNLNRNLTTLEMNTSELNSSERNSDSTHLLLLQEAHELIDNLSFTKAKQIYQQLLSLFVNETFQTDDKFRFELDILYQKLSLYGTICSASFLYVTKNYSSLYEKMETVMSQYRSLIRHSSANSKLLLHVYNEYLSYSRVFQTIDETAQNS